MPGLDLLASWLFRRCALLPQGPDQDAAAPALLHLRRGAVAALGVVSLTLGAVISGAPRSGEPGNHNPGMWLWVPGPLASLASRNDAAKCLKFSTRGSA